MKNKNKKLIAAVTLGIMFFAGTAIGGSTAKSFGITKDISMGAPIENEIINSNYDEEVYLNDLLSQGLITKEEYDLEKTVLLAKTDEEQQKAYINLLDYYMKKGDITQEEYNLEKAILMAKTDEEIDKAYEALVGYYDREYEKYLDELLSSGYITKEEYDLEKVILSAKTVEEEKKAYDNLIDYHVRTGKLTEEEGKEIKSFTYEDVFGM